MLRGLGEPCGRDCTVWSTVMRPLGPVTSVLARSAWHGAVTAGAVLARSLIAVKDVAGSPVSFVLDQKRPGWFRVAASDIAMRW